MVSSSRGAGVVGRLFEGGAGELVIGGWKAARTSASYYHEHYRCIATHYLMGLLISGVTMLYIVHEAVICIYILLVNDSSKEMSRAW